jgi:hypothetical protein
MKIISFIVSLIVGFGFWYLIMWMYTTENLPILWSTINKTIFLLLGVVMTIQLDEKFSK